MGLTDNYQHEFTYIRSSYHYSDPWKFLAVYQFPRMNRSTEFPRINQSMVEQLTNESYYEHGLEWYRIDVAQIESMLRYEAIPFQEISYEQLVLDTKTKAIRVHDEL